MSEGMEMDKIELQEMARAILCEIYGAEKAQDRFAASDFLGRTNRAEYSFESGLDGFDRRRVGFEAMCGLQRQAGSADEVGQLSFGLKQRELLEQRTERLKRGTGALQGTVFTSEAAEGDAIKQSGNLAQADLPEKLSDIFCRDARRYDGVFERY